MRIPPEILNMLDDVAKKRLEKSVPSKNGYTHNLSFDGKSPKEKTSGVLWGIYHQEGYHRFMQVANNMRSFKDKDFNDMIQVKGEVAEVILEILVYQFVKENNITDWWVTRGLILGSAANEKFSTELDMVLVTPHIVVVFETKSYNGEKTLTDNCTLTANNGGQVLKKDVFLQNKLHIGAFWDNFSKFATATTGVVKSVLFSFSKGNIVDKRNPLKISIMPVYTEDTVPTFLKAVHAINREPVWEVEKLVKAVEKAQREARSADDHVQYVKSLHSG